MPEVAGRGPARPLLATGAVVVYVLIALVAFWPVGPFSNARVVTCGCNDIAQQTWFLAWPRYALSHGLDPLFSGWLNYPYGVNVTSNPSAPLLGVLSIPVNLAFGPVAGFNAILRLGFIASATSMFFVLRQLVRFWPAAFFGGLLYGFSPYMIGQGNGHVNLVFVAIPPLVFLLLAELLVVQRWNPRTIGLVLGALLIAQFLISTEVFADTMILSVIGVLVLCVARRGLVHARARHALTGGAWGAGLFVLVAGYPIWFFLKGPQHITGPAQPIASLTPYRADLLGPIVPTIFERLAPVHFIAIGDSFAAGNVPENGSYLGIPLVIALVLIVIACRRRPLVRFAAVMAFVAFVLALGTRLVVDNHVTAVPLPFAIFTHLPLVRSGVALRFFCYVDLFSAVLLACGVDALARGRIPVGSAPESVGAGAGQPSVASGRAAISPRTAIACLVGAAVLVALFPRLPYSSPETGVPTYFTTSAVAAIPAGSAVLTYPYTINPDNYSMLWVAQTNMRFRVLGDWAITPDANGNGTTSPPLLDPIVVQQLFEAAMYGQRSSLGAAPAFDGATRAAIREFLSRYSISTVILDPVGDNPALVTRYLDLVLGRPTSDGGVELWYDVPRLLSEHVR